MKLNDFNINKNDYKYLIIVLIFSLLSIFYRTKFHMSGGVLFPDKALYLMNALAYSGMDYNNIVHPEDIFYSPIISYLTSLLFDIGIVDQLAISLVSSFFAIFGYFGLYLLLKNRFNPLLSLTGVILFGSTSEFLFNLSSGLLDVPAVSISIWILVLTIIGINKNSKYLILIFPLGVMAFFTRYTAGFMLPIIFTYYLIKRNFLDNLILLKSDYSLVKNKLIRYLKSKEFKFILTSIILGGLLFIIIIKFLILDLGGSLTFIDQSQNTLTGNQQTGGTDYLADKLYYIKNFPELLFNEERALDSTLVSLIYSIVILGSLTKIIKIIKEINFNELKNQLNTNKILTIFLILSASCSFFVFKVISNSIISIIFLIISIIIIDYLFKKFAQNKDNFTFLIVNLTYLSVYLIFMSIYPIKVIRYALPILPPFIFFAIWGLEGIIDLINKKFNLDTSKKEKKINIDFGKIMPLILIIILIISTFTFIEPMKIEGYTNSLVDASEYIISHDPDYHSKTFASNYHNSRLIKWNLKENLTYIDDDPKMLDLSNATYIIDWENYEYKNYHEIYHNHDYHIYYHN